MAQLLAMGVDGEMTGTDLVAGHRLVQIGIACVVDPDGRPCDALDVTDGPAARVEVLERVVGWGEHEPLVCNPRSMEVHGISTQRIRAAAHHTRVDTDVANWLVSHGARSRPPVVAPVGFNVARFDVPFIDQALPRTAALLSRQTIDLNALVAGLSGVRLGGEVVKRAGLKRMAKRWAADQLEAAGMAVRWHQAGFDAAVAVLALRWLRWAALTHTLPEG